MNAAADSEKPGDAPGAAVRQRVAEATFRCEQPVSTVAKHGGRTPPGSSIAYQVFVCVESKDRLKATLLSTKPIGNTRCLILPDATQPAHRHQFCTSTVTAQGAGKLPVLSTTVRRIV